jgi:hypothetical protein
MICFLVGIRVSVAQEYRYYLAVCSMFQNEARFMREWLEFHKIVGVQHFYLYNNNSTDDYMGILRDYIDRGEVELFDWPHANKLLAAQNSAFNDALNCFRGVARWVAFIDLDEFLFPVRVNGLCEFLKDYEAFGAVCANWVMYGTSDVEKIPEWGLLTEYLVKREKIGNKHIKSIVQPEKAKYFHNCPHFVWFKDGYYQVNADKVRFQGPFSPYIAIDKLRINHYWARDKYYVYNVKIPRVEALHANHMVIDNDSWYIPRSESKAMTARQWVEAIIEIINQVEDRTIYKYMDQLKTRLFGHSKKV